MGKRRGMFHMKLLCFATLQDSLAYLWSLYFDAVLMGILNRVLYFASFASTLTIWGKARIKVGVIY